MSEVPTPQNELMLALFAIQNELVGIVKGEENSFFKNHKYADRTAILQELRPLFQKHGLLLMQNPVPPPPQFTEPVLALQTAIVHVASGNSTSSIAIVPLPKSDPQGYGSALTYTSRYALVMMLALPLLEEDDDGNSASRGKTDRPTRAVAKTATVAPSTQTQEQTTATGADTTTKVDPKTAATEGKSAGRKLWGK